MCAVNVPFTPPVDCQEITFPTSEIKITHLEPLQKKTIHCSLQDESFDESQCHVDNKSLLGCHRDDEDEGTSFNKEGKTTPPEGGTSNSATTKVEKGTQNAVATQHEKRNETKMKELKTMTTNSLTTVLGHVWYDGPLLRSAGCH